MKKLILGILVSSWGGVVFAGPLTSLVTDKIYQCQATLNADQGSEADYKGRITALDADIQLQQACVNQQNAMLAGAQEEDLKLANATVNATP